MELGDLGLELSVWVQMLDLGHLGLGLEGLTDWMQGTFDERLFQWGWEQKQANFF